MKAKIHKIMVQYQFAIRTIANRRCTLDEALSICARVNTAACNRYLHRKKSLHSNEQLDILQRISLPSALRTLDTHLIFHAVNFERQVEEFERQNNFLLIFYL